MGDVYVMRRANGDLFTEEMQGKVRIPVWSSRDAADRYKARNPELSVFLPARLDRLLLNKIKTLNNDGPVEFFLLSDEDPNASLDEGRPIRTEEIFPEQEATSGAALSTR
jgi:hypothetical protein